MDGGRDPLGLPGARQQSLELNSLGPPRDRALEHVGRPSQSSAAFSLAVAAKLATIARWSTLRPIPPRTAAIGPAQPAHASPISRTPTRAGYYDRLLYNYIPRSSSGRLPTGD